MSKFEFGVATIHPNASEMMKAYEDIKTRTGISLFGVSGYTTVILDVKSDFALLGNNICVIMAVDDEPEETFKFLNMTFNTIASSTGLNVTEADVNLASYCYAYTKNEKCPFNRHQMALALFLRYKKDDYAITYKEDVIKKMLEKLSILAVGCNLLTAQWTDIDGVAHEVITSEEFVTNESLCKELSEFLSMVNKAGFGIGGAEEYSVYVNKAKDSEIDVYAVAAFYYVTDYQHTRPTVENMFTALASLHYYLLNIV